MPGPENCALQDADFWAGLGRLVILPGATDTQGEPAVGQTRIGVRERPGADLEGAPSLEKHLGFESAPRSQPSLLHSPQEGH